MTETVKKKDDDGGRGGESVREGGSTRDVDSGPSLSEAGGLSREELARRGQTGREASERPIERHDRTRDRELVEPTTPP